MRRLLIPGLLACALTASGCQSTQDKSAELKAAGKGALNQKGVKVQNSNSSIKVLSKESVILLLKEKPVEE